MSGELRQRVAAFSAAIDHEVDRAVAQMDFADRLRELHPEKARAWAPLVSRAREAMAQAVAAGSLENIRRGVAEVERVLSPLAPTARSYTMHCVGHAHIDMNWMWSWPETVAVTVDTFSTVLQLMDEYPEFTFSQSQASVYQVVERYRPDMLKRIADRVREGRWEVTASHWVEGDRNMAADESLCRHLLYTRRYMQRLFDLKPEDVPIDWSPDTFGHPATVPTYLVRGGVRYVYMHRPGTLTQPKRWMFWWEGPDGARVLVRNDSASRAGYNGAITPDACRELVLFAKDTGLRDFMFVYGVGDHGGGPTRRDLERALDMARWPVFPRVVFSTARRFFDLAAAGARNLPVWKGELNFEFTGCYTSQSLIKRANRLGEHRLAGAETVAALSAAAGCVPYPAAAFEEGWRRVLFNQFHDILPGSCVRDSRTHAHGAFQDAMALSSQAEAAALQGLAGRVDTSAFAAAALPPASPAKTRSATGAGAGFGTGEGGLSHRSGGRGDGSRPLLVFNPAPSDRREVAEATLWDNGPAGSVPMRDRTYTVRFADGSVEPAQVTGGGNYWGHDYATVAFPVKLPGLAYAACAVMECATPAAAPASVARLTGQGHHCAYAPVERSPEGLENEFLHVAIDPRTGGIARLLDKSGGSEFVAPTAPAPVLEYEVERPHGMNAWSVQHASAGDPAPRLVELQRGLKGPWKATLTARFRIEQSTMDVTYELRAGDPKLYLSIGGTWFQRGTRETGVPALFLCLPLAIRGARLSCEIPFGAIERGLNRREDVPSLRWVSVAGRIGGKAAACLVLNDCKYGHSLDGSTLRVSLIRSSYEPDDLPEIGKHEMRFALRLVAGRLPVEEAIREGAAFNQPLRVLGTDVHEGALPATGQFIRTSPSSVVVSGVKEGEDGGLLVRLVNPTERRVTAHVGFDPRLVPSPKRVGEVDLLERDVEGGTAKVAGRTASVSVPARGMATLIVR